MRASKRTLLELQGRFKVGPGDPVEDIRRARELMGIEDVRLAEDDRGSVAEASVENLHGEREPDAEAAWDADIRRRVEELDSGAVETIPWTEVRKRLFRGLE